MKIKPVTKKIFQFHGYNIVTITQKKKSEQHFHKEKGLPLKCDQKTELPSHFNNWSGKEFFIQMLNFKDWSKKSKFYNT